MEKDFWDKITEEINKNKNIDNVFIASEVYKGVLADSCTRIAEMLGTLQRITSHYNYQVIASVISSVIVNDSKNFDEAFYKL